jgi:hypothetical protein
MSDEPFDLAKDATTARIAKTNAKAFPGKELSVLSIFPSLCQL